MKLLIVLMSAMVCITLYADPAPVTIGAFNIQIFGLTKVNHPHVLHVLAQVASRYDLLAIEEVGSNGSTASDATCQQVMDKFVGEINQEVGSDDYGYVRGNQYGVIFRKASFEVTTVAVYSGTTPFTYPPLTAFVKAKSGTLDFSLVVIHTRPEASKTEVPSLTTVMKETSTKNRDPDVICMGDFNGDGTYYSEGTSMSLAGFPPTDYVTVIGNDADTTVAKSSNTYDRIELTKATAEDFEGEAGVLDYTTFVDVGLAEGTTSKAGTAAAVSDHYPIWAKLWIDRDTD